jgi:cytochrome b561
MWIVMLIVIVAFVFGAMQGEPDDSTAVSHLVIGALVLLLVVVQVAMGTFRPHKGTPWFRSSTPHTGGPAGLRCCSRW